MKLFQALNIVGADGTVSITNVILLISMAIAAIDPGIMQLSMLGMAILNFNLHRVFLLQTEKKQIQDQQRFDRMQSEIERLQREFEKLNAAVSFTKMGR